MNRPVTGDAPVDRSRTGSWFADAERAQRALALVLPSIEAAVARPAVSGGGFLSIVVMNPGLGPADCDFEDAVLIEHDIGERARWDADYNAFARAKARLSWRHAMDSHAVQSARPHWLRPGDTSLWGSVCLDGIVVGVSGAEAWYDEAFATMVAAALRALVKEAAAREKQLFVGARSAGSAASQ